MNDVARAQFTFEMLILLQINNTYFRKYFSCRFHSLLITTILGLTSNDSGKKFGGCIENVYLKLSLAICALSG